MEIDETNRKIRSLTEQLKVLRKENDDLKLDLESKVNFTKFSKEEITEAMEKCNMLAIGEGGYGRVYKGEIRRTSVAIKLLKKEANGGQKHVRQEVDILSRVRHPNLVTLVGACPEEGAIVYEYLSGGTLFDRLALENKQPPLTWQARLRIASEICSALVFLHSHKPDSIVHGDLKPTNILFDANDVTKLSDFGICRVIPQTDAAITAHRTTCLKKNDGYLDPLYCENWKLTTKADVYAFGVILLRLLTNKPPQRLVANVQRSVDKGKLKDELDSSAKWPKKLAEEFAELALKCCILHWKDRADLATEVWESLERMKKEHYSKYSLFG